MRTRIGVLCEFLLWSMLVLAQKPAPAAKDVPAFNIEGAFWAIVVADLDASERWYTENLGFHRVKKKPAPTGKGEAVVLEGHGIYIEMVHYPDEKNFAAQVGPKDGQRLTLGIFKLGATVRAETFDQLVKALHQRNVQFVGNVFDDKEMGVRSFIVRDNTGILVQFFARTGGQN